jgi:hypothetical protein
MNIAKSSRGDPRLTGAGGRKVWPWIRSAFLFIIGFIVVYPGGIAAGLALDRAPDLTPFAHYIFLGMGVNLVISTLLILSKKKLHALAFFAPVPFIIGIELLRYI